MLCSYTQGQFENVPICFNNQVNLCPPTEVSSTLFGKKIMLPTAGPGCYFSREITVPLRSVKRVLSIFQHCDMCFFYSFGGGGVVIVLCMPVVGRYKAQRAY